MNNFMRITFNSVCFGWLLCCIACQPKQSGNPTEDQLKVEVKQTLNDMWAAIEAEDSARYASFIHPDFTQFGENDRVLLVGKQAEVLGTKQWMEKADSIHTEMVDPKITINGNVAWIVYYWQDRSIMKGSKAFSQGKSTRIFVRENDRWLCIHGHYTSLP
jgi:ketosteroid isomerase-like protein